MPVRQFVIACALTLPLAACGSVAEGVTRAVLADRGDDGEDTRKCTIEGEDFVGLERELDARRGSDAVLKVFMVHGIGSHAPGYSGTLSANLAEGLGLTARAPQIKQIELKGPSFPDETLGVLSATRYSDAARTREMIFYELTWSSISAPAKQVIAFDSTKVYSRERASLNNLAKTWANDILPDPLVYAGNGRLRILQSVGQGTCWALSSDWDGFPTDTRVCDTHTPGYASRLGVDELAFVTHSLGSRIVLDELQALVTLGTQPDSQLTSVRARLQAEHFTVFMLANQLPLLQAGFEPPDVVGQIPAYCRPGGSRYAQRFFDGTEIVAFSDPNDLLSYPIPDDFVQKHMDSRICPAVTNVTLNVVSVQDVPVLGELADPAGAHLDYENDPRVIALMVGGLGQPETRTVVEERCTWQEVTEDLR
jgi:hypothetical protein